MSYSDDYDINLVEKDKVPSELLPYHLRKCPRLLNVIEVLHRVR
jgi:hypothetical protein